MRKNWADLVYWCTQVRDRDAEEFTAIENIENELEHRYRELDSQGKLLEAQRIKMRTTFDLEMIRELGFCSGIEN